MAVARAALDLGFTISFSGILTFRNAEELRDVARFVPLDKCLIELAGESKVVAIGETGLDYYRIGERSRDEMHWQRERFRAHIRTARQVRKPLIVHTRSASVDTLAILREEGAEQAGGVFHCFTETMDVARGALDLGFMVSFSGILTFRNADALRDVARFVPLDRCLIETDSP
jgi:TatD DNase family protein